MDDVGKLVAMTAGLRVFIRVSNVAVCRGGIAVLFSDVRPQHKRAGTSFSFRISSEAVNFLAPLMTKRKFAIGLDGELACVY